jgi:hypothetical protein
VIFTESFSSISFPVRSLTKTNFRANSTSLTACPGCRGRYHRARGGRLGERVQLRGIHDRRWSQL